MNKPEQKFHLISAELMKQIKQRKYVGRLPGIRELAMDLNVNFKTVNKAISDLVEKGILERERGRGACIVDHSNTNKTIGILAKASGDLYEKMVSLLSSRLQQMNYTPVVLDIISNSSSRKFIRSQLNKMIELKPSVLIVEGDYTFPFDVLKRVENQFKKIIFIHHAETGIDFNADYILSDPWYGAYLATQHLLSLGHERILFIGPDWRILEPLFFRNTDFCQLQYGYHTTLEVAGLLKNESYFYYNVHEQDSRKGQEAETRLQLLLEDKDRPTAIISFADFRMKMVYDVARKLKLRVPDDLALIGYYNTKWCDVFTPALSSVSLNEEELIDKVVERIKTRKIDKERIIVKPELVIRKSCGAGK